MEYLYPAALRAAAFKCDVSDLADIDFENDPIEANGIRKKKKKKKKKGLAAFVVEDLTDEHELDAELQRAFQLIRT